jgi:1-acyl-sn-glycerol-3-phosphate acyltransferase
VVPGERPLLIVSNHQSLLDIPVLHVTLGRAQLIRFVVKRELKWGVPNISPSCRFAGYAFVDRRREAYARNLAELTRFARRLVSDGASGVIFPEGTWEPRGQPLPFRGAGLETILKTARLAVLPVVVDGTWQAPGFRDLWNRLGSLKMRVEIGELIPASEAARDLEGLTKRLHREIHGKLASMRQRSEAAESSS